MRNWKQSCITLLAVIILLSSGSIQVSAQSSQRQSIATVTQATSVNEEKKDDIQNTKKQDTKNDKRTITAGNLQIKYWIGLEGYYRIGNYVELKLEVTNQGEDFEGEFFAIKSGDSIERTRYQESVMVASKETKIISMSILLPDSSPKMYFQVYDDKAKEYLYQDKIEPSIKVIDGISIGVLAENMSELNYMSKTNIQVIPLQVEGVPSDCRVLQSLDYLVINNFSSAKLSDEQYKEIKEWVNLGGTLVIGTGENASKTMELFRDDLLVSELGKETSISTSIGVQASQVEGLMNYWVDLDSLSQYEVSNEKEIIYNKELVDAVEKGKKEEQKELNKGKNIPTVNKKIITLHLEGAAIKLSEGEVPLLYQKEYGKGSILLTTFDLALPNDTWGVLGNQIVKQLLCNMNNQRTADVERYTQNTPLSYMKKELASFNMNIKLPKTTTFLWIILIYLILVGPIAYFICKKMKKNQWLWGIVPMIAIVFTCLVYYSGVGTRIKNVSSAYSNLIYLSDNVSSEEVIFSLTTPFNENYKVQIDDKYKISNFVDDYSYYDTSDVTNNTSKYAIGYSKEKNNTSIKLNDMRAFSSTYYTAQRTLDSSGNLEITVDKNMGYIMGTVRNSSAYDYSHALVIVEGKVYFLGKLPKGKEVSLNDSTAVYTWEELLDYKGRTLLSDELQADRISENRISLLSYLREYYNIGYTYDQGLFLGYLESDYESEFEKSISVDSQGISLAVQTFPYQTSDIETSFIYDISSYAKAVNSQEVSYDFEGEYNALTKKQDVGCIFSYVFSSKDIVTSLAIDEGVYQLGYEVMDSISAYNYETNQFEPILSKEKKKVQGDILRKYFNVNNTLLLKYQSSRASLMDEAQLLPIISATKEEK